ncbi:MAG: allantoinase AllB [Nocardioidaceae bacterium]
MTDLDLLFRALRVVTSAGEVSRCVGVRHGRIVAIEALDHPLEAEQVVDLGDDVVLMPGVVDSHVHVNEPGRSEWEGFATATRAAAAGGVTTIVDMPLNSIPPTVDLGALEVKRKTAQAQCSVDVGFWGGAVPGNVADLRGMHDAGVYGFKCFLLPSGVDEFPHLGARQLEDAMREVQALGALLIVHAEDSHAVDRAPAAHGRAYADFLASRPRDAENVAVAQVVELARRTGCRVHVLHLSSSDALSTIASARRDGVPITVETCPHYLTFTAEEIPDGATQFKCCPPIREADNRERLWRGLADGDIDCVVTDHSPCTPELKRFDTGDFGEAWGGVSSLQLGLSAVWTEARRRGHPLTDVVRWMCERPAEHTGLLDKGRISLGYAADLCVFAPEEVFVVDVGRLQHRNPVTPYAGRDLAGVVRSTWLRGRRVQIESEPRGRLLRRGET